MDLFNLLKLCRIKAEKSVKGNNYWEGIQCLPYQWLELLRIKFRFLCKANDTPEPLRHLLDNFIVAMEDFIIYDNDYNDDIPRSFFEILRHIAWRQWADYDTEYEEEWTNSYENAAEVIMGCFEDASQEKE